MSNDYTAIGKLVTKAQELLDSIKGGAIQKMQNAFDALMGTINSEWKAKKKQVDDEALAAIKRINTGSVISDLGFMAINYNDDFRDVATVTRESGDKNQWPIGVSWNPNCDFNEFFKAEIIPVQSTNPSGRPEEIKELLDAMEEGRNKRYLYEGGFNVLKLTVDKSPDLAEGVRPWMHICTDYHASTRGGLTFMYYLRSPATNNAWEQIVSQRQRAGASPNSSPYSHFDASPLSHAEVGDSIYIALPTICVGRWPTGLKHSKMENLRNQQVRGDNYLKNLIGSEA